MRNMQGQKFISRMNFQSTKHHRQALRQQIKPELIQQIEVSQNPSANYMNAYKNVFKDELEKTMDQHYQKKMESDYKHKEQQMHYSMSTDRYRGQPFEDKTMGMSNRQTSHNYPMQNSPVNHSKFRDYFEQRGNRFEDHIKSNYDGGQSFFKIQDAYRVKKQQQIQNYASILRRQLDQKQYSKLTQRQKQNQEHHAVREFSTIQNELDRQRYISQQHNRQQMKYDKLIEVNEQRQRKQRQSKQWQPQNIGLHNPITNPIEYHIDNPYILKKIQDKSGF